MYLDSAEAARKKTTDAAAAAAAAAELRSSLGQTSNEVPGATQEGTVYNHTGAEEVTKPAVGGGGRPGPGGGGGGVSKVIGAAEAAERDKYNADRGNEVRLATPHTGTSASESGNKIRNAAKVSPSRHQGKAGEAAVSPLEHAYASKPCMILRPPIFVFCV